MQGNIEKDVAVKSDHYQAESLCPFNVISTKINSCASKSSGLLMEFPHSTSENNMSEISQVASKASPNFNIETNDELSLLVAAATSVYFNTLFQQQTVSNSQTAFSNHSNSSLVHESSTASPSIKDIEALSHLTSLNFDPILDPLLAATKSRNFPTSECATTVGLNSPTKTIDFADSNIFLLNSSLPVSYSASNYWDKLSSTTAGRICENSYMIGSPAAQNSNEVNIQNDDCCLQLTGTHEFSNNFFGLSLSSQIHGAAESYSSKAILPNTEPGSSKASDKNRSRFYPTVALHQPNKESNSAMTKIVDDPKKDDSSYQQRKPSLHPATLLYSKGVGGRHFFPPIVLAHPEEFRNPSSFLKVYGDPLCGAEIKLAHNEHAASGGSSRSHLLSTGKNGNWICTKCQNINYPRRYRCNKCNQIRGANGDLIVSEYALRVYYHHLKTYKDIGGNNKDSPVASSLFSSPPTPSYSDQFHQQLLSGAESSDSEFQTVKDSALASTIHFGTQTTMNNHQGSNAESFYPPSRAVSIDEIDEIIRFHSPMSRLANSENSGSVSNVSTGSNLLKYQNQSTIAGEFSSNFGFDKTNRQLIDYYPSHHTKCSSRSATPKSNLNYSDINSPYVESSPQSHTFNSHSHALHTQHNSSSKVLLNDESMCSPKQHDVEEFHTPVSSIRTPGANVGSSHTQKSNNLADAGHHLTVDATQGFSALSSNCSIKRVAAANNIWKDLSTHNNNNAKRNRNSGSLNNRFTQMKSPATSVASNIARPASIKADLQFPNLR